MHWWRGVPQKNTVIKATSEGTPEDTRGGKKFFFFYHFSWIFRLCFYDEHWGCRCKMVLRPILFWVLMSSEAAKLFISIKQLLKENLVVFSECLMVATVLHCLKELFLQSTATTTVTGAGCILGNRPRQHVNGNRVMTLADTRRRHKLSTAGLNQLLFISGYR